LAFELLPINNEEQEQKKEEEEEECEGEAIQSQTIMAARSCHFCSGGSLAICLDPTRETTTTATTTTPTATAITTTTTTTSTGTPTSIMNFKESEDEQELDFFIHTKRSADVSSCTASVRSVDVQDTKSGSTMSPLSYEDAHHHHLQPPSNHNHDRIDAVSFRTDAVAAALGKPNHLQKFHAVMGDKSCVDYPSPNQSQTNPTKSLPPIHPGQGKYEEKLASSSSSSSSPPPTPQQQQQQARSCCHPLYSPPKRDPFCVDENDSQRGRFPSKRPLVHHKATPDRSDPAENGSGAGKDGVVFHFKTGEEQSSNNKQTSGWDPSFVRILARHVNGLTEQSSSSCCQEDDNNSHQDATRIRSMDQSIINNQPDSLPKPHCICYRHAHDHAQIKIFCFTRTVEIVFDDEDASNSQFVRYNCSIRHLQAILKNPIAESQVIQALCVAHNHHG